LLNTPSLVLIGAKMTTHPKLLEALFDAGRRKPTEHEIHQQRVSFIVGSMRENSPVTRERIEHVLAEQEGRAFA
jgi:hypothetical protein